jgi:putative hydrolase of the HAD superfamily
MPRPALDLIAFDADDTLWHNERTYRHAREQYRGLLARAGVSLSVEEIEARLNETEIANLPYYGYGVSSFTLSLIETAIDLTGGRITGKELRAAIDLAKQMLTENVELFPGVREILAALASRYRLMLITKGDLLHQTSKLERSGLREFFGHVEVVSHKSRDVYAAILSRHVIAPERFLMIGDSLRSDVLPVVEAGGWAVHVPAALSWSHEHADLPAHLEGRHFQVPVLGRVVEIVEQLERVAQKDR